MLVSLIRSFSPKVSFSKHKSVKRTKKPASIDWTSVFIYIVMVMSTVEELLYGLRTTDGSALEFFFLKSFLN